MLRSEVPQRAAAAGADVGTSRSGLKSSVSHCQGFLNESTTNMLCTVGNFPSILCLDPKSLWERQRISTIRDYSATAIANLPHDPHSVVVGFSAKLHDFSPSSPYCGSNPLIGRFNARTRECESVFSCPVFSTGAPSTLRSSVDAITCLPSSSWESSSNPLCSDDFIVGLVRENCFARSGRYVGLRPQSHLTCLCVWSGATGCNKMHQTFAKRHEDLFDWPVALHSVPRWNSRQVYCAARRELAVFDLFRGIRTVKTNQDLDSMVVRCSKLASDALRGIVFVVTNMGILGMAKDADWSSSAAAMRFGAGSYTHQPSAGLLFYDEESDCLLCGTRTGEVSSFDPRKPLQVLASHKFCGSPINDIVMCLESPRSYALCSDRDVIRWEGRGWIVKMSSTACSGKATALCLTGETQRRLLEWRRADEAERFEFLWNDGIGSGGGIVKEIVAFHCTEIAIGCVIVCPVSMIVNDSIREKCSED